MFHPGYYRKKSNLSLRRAEHDAMVCVQSLMGAGFTWVAESKRCG